MSKRTILACLAVAACAALAAPATAGASKLTMPEGTLVPEGNAITGTADGTLFIVTPLGTIECASMMFNVEVAKNTGTEVEGKPLPGSGATGCTRNKEEGVVLSEIEVRSLKSITSGGGTIELSFGMSLFGGSVHCYYETPEAGAFTYKAGAHEIEISGKDPLFLESEVCGEAVLSGKILFEKKEGGPAVIFD